MATFEREPYASGTSVVPEKVEGEIFTPFLPAYGDKRIMLLLTPQDREAFDSLPDGRSRSVVEVWDLLTDTTFTVRRARCGLGCYCAAEVVE